MVPQLSQKNAVPWVRDNFQLGVSCSPLACHELLQVASVWWYNLCIQNPLPSKEKWAMHCSEVTWRIVHPCVSILQGRVSETRRQLESKMVYIVSTPCIGDHHFKEEETKSVGELSKVCSQIVLKFLYLARIGRPDILMVSEQIARSITKWTKACGKRLNRLISYIHHTCEYKQ